MTLSQTYDWFLQLDVSTRNAFLSLGGTLITAIVALLVVSLNLMFSRWKHRQDAEMALRKEIYISASEAFSDALAALTQLPRIEFTIEDGSAALRKFSVAIGKIVVVGTQPTQEVVFSVMERYMGAFHEMSRRKMLLNDGLEKVAALAQRLENLGQLRESAIEFRNKTLAGTSDETTRSKTAETVYRDLARFSEEERECIQQRTLQQATNQAAFLDATEFATANVLAFGKINTDLV